MSVLTCGHLRGTGPNNPEGRVLEVCYFPRNYTRGQMHVLQGLVGV